MIEKKKTFQSIIFIGLASLAAAKPSVLQYAVAPAAVIAPYASTYNAHVVNHAVSAPIVAAPAVARAFVAAPAPVVAAPAIAARSVVAAPGPFFGARAAFAPFAPAVSPYYASPYDAALW